MSCSERFKRKNTAGTCLFDINNLTAQEKNKYTYYNWVILSLNIYTQLIETEHLSINLLTLMCKCSSMVFLISSEPHTMHGVVPHNYKLWVYHRVNKQINMWRSFLNGRKWITCLKSTESALRDSEDGVQHGCSLITKDTKMCQNLKPDVTWMKYLPTLVRLNMV